MIISPYLKIYGNICAAVPIHLAVHRGAQLGGPTNPPRTQTKRHVLRWLFNRNITKSSPSPGEKSGNLLHRKLSPYKDLGALHPVAPPSPPSSMLAMMVVLHLQPTPLWHLTCKPVNIEMGGSKGGSKWSLIPAFFSRVWTPHAGRLPQGMRIHDHWNLGVEGGLEMKSHSRFCSRVWYHVWLYIYIYIYIYLFIYVCVDMYICISCVDV